MPDLLRSWNEGPVRSALVSFLDAGLEIDPRRRVAIFDNDGTLWCEKPNYPQLVFFVGELQRAVAAKPELADVPEYRAVLEGDRATIEALGVERIGLALVGLFEGLTPDDFAARVKDFFARAQHPDLDRRWSELRYQPMLELIAELETRGFDVFIGTAGGADFVRAVSLELYGIAPERIVGSRVSYRVVRVDTSLRLLRTAELDGVANEGEAKLPSIQRQIGRRPIFGAGNSPGDAEMLEYVSAGPDPSLALLVDHDDADREYAYESVAGTFEAAEPITATAERLGWAVASMRSDWTTVFPDDRPAGPS